MKRLLALLLLCCMLLPCAGLAEATEAAPEYPIFDLENRISFGMTKDEVLALEAAATFDYDDTLAYEDYALYGQNSTVNYRFNENYLLEAIIIYFEDKKPANEDDYIADFDSVDAQLIAQYGSPTLEKSYTWHDEAYKTSQELHGLALTSGHVEILSTWLTDDIACTHSIYQEAITVIHMLTIRPNDSTAE